MCIMKYSEGKEGCRKTPREIAQGYIQITNKTNNIVL